MGLIQSFINNPIKVAVGVLLVSLFGLLALTKMPMQLTPEVQTPTISIETRWPGASPQEVEQEIVVEQEEQLKGVESVTEMSSDSMNSMGKITLEFQVGTDMQKAVVDVISRLEQVPDYPENADKPVISTSNVNSRAIAWFILSAKLPAPEQFDAFEKRFPELKDDLRPVRESHNIGLSILRLRRLAQNHPEVAELLPPKDLDLNKMRRFAEDEIEARFERIEGVSQSEVRGGTEDELQVIVDPQKLAARGLTINDVRRVLGSQNEDTSAGDYWEGKRRWITRTLGQFRSPEQVQQQLLAIRDGAPVYIGDVAEVRLGYKKPEDMVRRFGEANIAINVIRSTGANVLDIMQGLQVVNRELNEGILNDRGLTLTQVYDETDYIYSSVSLVQQNIFIGGALTMIVLMGFLHLGTRVLLVIPFIVLTAIAAAYISPWFFAVCLAIIIGAGFWLARGALVVGLAIPTSIVGTFLVLGILGRSLNVVSLAGLAFAVGMLVDNAVVVLENIYRRYSLGEDAFDAAAKGTQEVWGAVVSSTLTTVAVFLPIVFIEDQAGQLFRDIALAISAAVALSMVVSMTVIPSAAARLFGTRTSKKSRSPALAASSIKGNGDRHGSHVDAEKRTDRFGWLSEFLVRPILGVASLFVNSVVAINDWIQRGLVRQFVFVVALLGVSIGLSYVFWPKVEYLPTGNRNLVITILLPPPGYNLDQLTQLGDAVEEELRPYWDIDPESPAAKELDFPVIADFFFVTRDRQIFMGVRAYDTTRVGELVPLVRKATAKLPGTFVVAKQSSLFEEGLTSGRTVEVEITGPDLRKLVGLGGRVLGEVMRIMPEAQARPIPSLDLSSPEVHVKPKLVQAAEMQVTNTDLGYVVDALVDGAYAGDYFLDGDKIDVTIMGRDDFSSHLQDIRALPVATPLGQVVPLVALADIELASGPEQVNHRERERAITIEVSPPSEMALEDAIAQIRTQIVDPIIAEGSLAGGYRIHLAGTADKLRDTWSALRFNVLLAVLITYLLMAALFESWLYPLVIILSVPLGAVGGIVGLDLLNTYLGWTHQLPQQLDVLTMLGFVILIGTVVNNPILIVHQTLNHIREDGMEPREAVLESVRTRVRPIFMTTTTTVLGLLPLVLFPGAGSELYRGLGSVVLGGLAISTVFTLFLVPTLFGITMQAKDSVLSLLGRGPEVPIPAKPVVTREPRVEETPVH